MEGLAEICRTTALVETKLSTLITIDEVENPGQETDPDPYWKFLRSSDRDLVLRAARNKGKLSWGNNNIMLFPDYSKAKQMKRDKFKEYKKKLHEQEVSFSMLYPAKLKIETKDGVKTFECPRGTAMAFIDAMM
ncbi:hypothetical protein SKAU_G00235550 [Synaphobranchus kaupii]|uniref:Transposase n=1 Tax=Synaphobranchus kaupii TaxID=118154 RepID=A0A9Q1F6Y1_SYNKA|nr:hypothetical protein SKAU_G00235550 [Synaphobranchus kaupii]